MYMILLQHCWIFVFCYHYKNVFQNLMTKLSEVSLQLISMWGISYCFFFSFSSEFAFCSPLVCSMDFSFSQSILFYIARDNVIFSLDIFCLFLLIGSRAWFSFSMCGCMRLEVWLITSFLWCVTVCVSGSCTSFRIRFDCRLLNLGCCTFADDFKMFLFLIWMFLFHI